MANELVAVSIVPRRPVLPSPATHTAPRCWLSTCACSCQRILADPLLRLGRLPLTPHPPRLHSPQGRPDPPAACPHVWQRVQYLSARPHVARGTRVGLCVTLTPGGGAGGAGASDLRIEYDEDVIGAVQQPSGFTSQRQGGGGPGAEGERESEGQEGEQAAGGASGLPPGEPLGASEGEEEEEQGGQEEAGGGVQQGGGTAGGTASHGMLLPYHMSMLNDRVRTRSYREGILGAVREAQVGWGWAACGEADVL